MRYLATFELTPFSIWIREEWWIFPLILVVHSLGMGLMAGIGAATAFRALGFAPGIPVDMMRRFVPLLWLGLAANTLSGLLLLAGYPAKGLTNPLLYLKLLLLAAALWLTLRLMNPAAGPAGMNPPAAALTAPRMLAVFALMSWIGVIASGRVIAYTHSVLLASWLTL